MTRDQDRGRFTADRRNAAALRLAEEVRTGPPGRAPLLGGDGLRPAQEAAGAGLGFSWPAAFPVAASFRF
ncbi:hypothetical protein ACFYRL_24945 [Streptomyces goshikiensis]|uniref:hypothetical protein n=1 Tax=Streptomyces goshikiensis TaxID=1942 RepID=UPI0036805F14